MVLKRPHIGLIALHVHQFKVLVLGQCLVAVTHSVALKVGLSRHVDTILVTKIIPTGIIRIVAGTYSIDVQLLHDFNVLNHARYGYHIATVWIQFMTVGTLNEDSLAVYQQLSVLDFNVTETNTLLDNFQHVVAFLQRNIQIVKIRSLS